MPNPFATPLATMQRNLTAVLPVITAKAGAIVVEHSNKAFIDGGFTDAAMQPWTPRKSKEVKDQGRAILVKTGRLRRSIRVVKATKDSVTIGTNVKYAKIHNEGGSINHPSRDGILNFSSMEEGQLWKFGKVRTVKQQRTIKGIRRVTFKEHTTKMPQRKFLGNSQKQTSDIKKMAIKELFSTFKVLPH